MHYYETLLRLHRGGIKATLRTFLGHVFRAAEGAEDKSPLIVARVSMLTNSFLFTSKLRMNIEVYLESQFKVPDKHQYSLLFELWF